MYLRRRSCLLEFVCMLIPTHQFDHYFLDCAALWPLQRRGALARCGAVTRVTFTEITRGAVTRALQHGQRDVSGELVAAYLARRWAGHEGTCLFLYVPV